MDTSSPSPVTVPITEDELRAVLLSRTTLTCADLGSMFKPRFKRREDREVFTAFLRKNCKLNVSNGNKYVVLREDTRYTSKCNVAAKETSSPFPRPLAAPSSGPITEDEIRAVFMTTDNVTTMHIVAVFKSRLRSREDKDAFAAKIRKICRINKINGISYICLKDTKRRR